MSFIFKKISILFKIIFVLFILNFLFIYSLSANNNNIKIKGNENIDDEIIFSIIDNKVTDYSNNNLNEIIKTLYSTGNFKNIEIEYIGDEIILIIEENPSINKITFYGNKRFKKDEIFEIFDRKKYFKTFNEFDINNFINDLKNLYGAYGYNIVDIDYKVESVEDSDRLVDITFNVNEGQISKINSINFIGNNSFGNSKLKSIIKSKTRNFLRPLANINYKKFQILEDKKKIINFYKENGFRDIEVRIENEFLSKSNKLNVYFYINEGDQYSFGEFVFNTENLNLNKDINDKIIDEEVNIFSKALKKNISYNPAIIENIKERLTESYNNNGKYFFDFTIKETKQNQIIDIEIKIADTYPLYVDQINVFGNTRTKESVIRRELTFSEGDPLNFIDLNKSKQKLNKLGFFKQIDIKDQKKEDENQVDIDIEIEEKSTGEFQVGISVDTFRGITFLAGLKEKNINGDGRELNLDINTSEKNTTYAFGIVEPYIADRDMDLLYDISYSDKNLSSSKSYELNQFNTSTGLSYALTEKTNHSIVLEYILKDYKITKTTAPDSVKKLAGTNVDILFKNGLNYYDLDSFLRPSKGTNIKFTNIISPSTNDENGYIKNIFTYNKYYTYNKKNILSVKTRVGNIFSLQGAEIPVDDKFGLGGRWLRGFDNFGAGPRESTTSYVGGNNLIVSKFDLQRPIFSETDNPIDFNVFTDVGKIFDNKTNPAYSNESIRASYGFGIKFYSPIGPIGFTWGFPLLKEDEDIGRMFLFSIGNLN